MIYFMRISPFLSIQSIVKYYLKYIMGIDGLLPLLKPLCKQEHISSFKGQSLGIDILPWLYKGCYSHVLQLSEKQLKDEFKYSCSNYLYEMLDMLAQNEIKVTAVFDGRSLPMKADTMKKRKESRESSNKKGEKMMEQNNVEMGRKFFARGIRVNQSIIQQAISILISRNIDFLVAPYESDCQLSKLKNLGLINAVVTQDSDLIVYGCNVIYKLDEEGMCEYLDLANIKNVDPQIDKNCRYLKQFLNFDHDTRIYACVLAGCDYVSSIKGIGFKKAINLLEKQNEIVKLIQNLSLDKLYGERVPIDYKERVINSIKIFKHATVFNPIKKQLESLNHLDMSSQGEEVIKILGQPYKQYIELSIFSGKINANSLLPRKIVDIKQQMKIEIQNINLKELINQMGLGIDQQPSSSLVQDNMFDALKVLECENKNTNILNYEAETIFWQNLVNLSIISILQL